MGLACGGGFSPVNVIGTVIGFAAIENKLSK
jgi:hypothetical protein